MVKENKLGGVNEMDKPALERAKKVDLITLPDDIDGTNCYNCKWISSHKNEYDAMCTHPKVRQYVNERMCCIMWSRTGEYRPFQREKGYD
jgi:hypothetical protein